jgi:iron-sulfur cluster repair protein YtfE (RIC family)
MSLSTHAPSLTQPHPSQGRNALDLILEAHEKLRSFTALAVQLGHARDALPAKLSEAAARVERFFSVSLPRHFEDEDYVLVPRLFTTALSLELVQHLWEVGRQHEELEQLVQQLAPLWLAVRDTPQRYPEFAEPLATGGRQLMKLVEAHLLLEERLLFPLIRSRLTAETLAELASRILERRGQLS